MKNQGAGPLDGPVDSRHETFLRLFTGAQPALRRFVIAHLPDRREVEDILQEAALVLWRKFDQFEQDRSFTAWALGIARNEILRMRHSGLRKHLVLSDAIAERLALDLETVASEMDQERVHLQNCLKKLPERPRRVVELYYGSGDTAEAIARALGSTVNTIGILLFRTREALARCIRDARSQEVVQGGPG
jgi:RNA polymerase sigma-70 factor (ECF subfamily)